MRGWYWNDAKAKLARISHHGDKPSLVSMVRNAGYPELQSAGGSCKK